MLDVTATLAIDESEFSERLVRASGPAGHNVNKERGLSCGFQ